MSFVSVVEIGGVVGDFVGQIDQLGFERRALVEQVFRKFGMVFCRVIMGVLDDALADFESKIQAAKGGVTLFEVFDNSKGMQVVIEREAMLVRSGIERFFSGMAEGRVSDVVDQG